MSVTEMWKSFLKHYKWPELTERRSMYDTVNENEVPGLMLLAHTYIPGNRSNRQGKLNYEYITEKTQEGNMHALKIVIVYLINEEVQ